MINVRDHPQRVYSNFRAYIYSALMIYLYICKYEPHIVFQGSKKCKIMDDIWLSNVVLTLTVI